MNSKAQMMWDTAKKLINTCNEMVAPEVAPISQPNNKPPRAGKRNLIFDTMSYYFCTAKTIQSEKENHGIYFGQKSQHSYLNIKNHMTLFIDFYH